MVVVTYRRCRAGGSTAKRREYCYAALSQYIFYALSVVNLEEADV